MGRMDNDKSNIIVSIRASLDGPDLTTKIISSTKIEPVNTLVWVEFNFIDIKVNYNGGTYYIVVTSDDNDIYDGYCAWLSSTENPYPDGLGYRCSSGQPWEYLLDWDFCFKTYGATSKSIEFSRFLEKFPVLYHLLNGLINKFQNLGKIF
jgi:hypothetical protein